MNATPGRDFLGPRSVAFWTVAAGIAAVVGLVISLLQFGSSPSPRTTPSPLSTTKRASRTPTAGNTPSTSTGGPATPVWSGPISIGNGIDFDSRPPASGSNNLEYDGTFLFSNDLLQIAAWTKSFMPSRDQCNVWVQTHPGNQVLSETGTGYCLLTGQGHTAYLQITSINPDVAGGTVHARAIVWRP